jgi:uncharacterized protein YjcR
MLEIPNEDQFKKDFYDGINYKNLGIKNFVSASTIYIWIKTLGLTRKVKR